MTTLIAPAGQTPEPAPPRARWRMPWGTAGIALLAVIGALAILYPSTASWFSQYNQSRVVANLEDVVDEGPPARLMNALAEAREYNEALISGELGTGALLDPSSNVPTSDGVSPGGFDYDQILRANNAGVMARLRIPAIDVDLPIYHGTSDEILAKGVGHLEGTSLPVGGLSQHSVLTAHRGLPEATLFNNLNKLEIGDTFTIEVFGEVLTYRVNSTETILPDQTESLLPEYDEDLVTLVTCTPLGVNTHRYLVTGERILPTPASDVAAAGELPDIPGFPWWAVILTGVAGGYTALVFLAGRPKKKRGDDVSSPPA